VTNRQDNNVCRSSVPASASLSNSLPHPLLTPTTSPRYRVDSKILSLYLVTFLS